MSAVRLLLHGELQLILLSFLRVVSSMLQEPVCVSLVFRELRQVVVALAEVLIDMIRCPKIEIEQCNEYKQGTIGEYH